VGRPRHPKKEVEEAIRYALDEKAWTLEVRKGKGHAWGVLRCPAGEDKVRVWGTPRSPGDHAKQIRQAALRCPHC
jgi:hypothetical protein